MKQITILVCSFLCATLVIAQTQWTPIGPEGGWVDDIVFHPDNPDILYVGGDILGGFYKSTDAGATWPLSGLAGKDVWELAICPDADSIYFAATYDSVYRSIDFGATWQAMDINSGKFYTFFFSIKIAPSDGNIIYAGSLFGVFKSTDRGETWSPVLDNGLPANRVWTLAIHPTNPDIVFMGQPGIGIWKSTDGAHSWQSANTGFRCHYAWEMQVDDQSNLYVGIYNELDNNLASVKKWDGVNSTWIELGNTGDQMVKELALDPTNPQVIYAGDINQEALGGTLYKSSNGGASWSKIGSGLPETQAFVSALAVDPASPNVVYAGTAVSSGFDGGLGIYKSTDGGSNFVLSGLASSQIIKIIIHPDSPQMVYAATLNNLYKSADAGASWQPMGLTNLPLPSLAMHPVNPQILFAGGYRFGVYKSTDGGVNWTPTSLDTGFVTSIVIDPVHPDRMFAAGGELVTNGIFYSADGGDTWEDFTQGLLNKEISRLAIDPNLGVMYASTVGYGVYKRQMPMATSVADDLRMPDGFVLSQNYPIPSIPKPPFNINLRTTAS